jgi:hypothetical protein
LQAKFNWRLIATALLAGAFIGFAGSRIAYELKLLHPPVEGPFQRMSAELKLTGGQREQASETIRQARERIGDAQREFEEKKRDLMVEAYMKIRSDLRPDQQLLLDRDFVPPSVQLRAQTIVESQNHSAMPPAAALPSAP